MERETIEITTPVDHHAVVLKSYITGREQRQLTNLLVKTVKDLSIDTKAQNVKVPEIDINLTDKAEDEAWRLIVVSVDGHKEGDVVEGQPFSIVDAILNMKLKDYETVKAKIKEIGDDRQFEENKSFLETSTAGS